MSLFRVRAPEAPQEQGEGGVGESRSHPTPGQGSGLMRSKALYKAGWVLFSPFHRWAVRAQERFPTCWVHKSLWNLPLSILPAAPQTQKPCLQKDGFAFLLLLEEWHLLGFSGRSILVLGCEVSGTRGRNLEMCQEETQRASSLQHLALLSPVFSSKAPVPDKTHIWGGSWCQSCSRRAALVCSELGWIDCAAVETQGQGTGVEGHTTGCCWRRRMKEIFMFCGASFPTLEKAFSLCVCVNAL